MNRIHPSAFIGPDVILGRGNVIGPNTVLAGRTVVGDDNWIGPGTCVGIDGDILGRPSASTSPYWLSDAGTNSDDFGVRIGSGNVLKEYVTIHAGSHRDTVIGDRCYLMPRSHLGHDCWIGDNVLMSPSAQVAGHVAVGSRSVIGMGALIHQFSTVGPVAMVGMGCCVRGAVEPCRTVVGEPHRVSGINRVGIERLVGADQVSSVLKVLKDKGQTTSFPEPLNTMIREWHEHIAVRH